MDLTGDVQPHDEVSDFDIADVNCTSEHGRDTEAVDLTLAWLQTRALRLAGQTDHQVLILPNTSVQFGAQFVLVRPWTTQFTGKHIKEKETAVCLEKHVTKRGCEERTFASEIKKRPGCEGVGITSKRESTYGLHASTLAKARRASMEPLAKLDAPFELPAHFPGATP